jgi:hypothetical protein
MNEYEVNPSTASDLPCPYLLASANEFGLDTCRRSAATLADG